MFKFSPPKDIPHSNAYIPSSLKSSTSAPWQQSILIELLGQIPNLTQAVSLDMSSGVGKNIATIRSLGVRHIIACDLNKEALDFSANINPADEYVIADVHKLPFDDTSFDLVICTEAIEHYERPLSAFSEIRRITKTGGYVVLSGQNHFNLAGLYKFGTEKLGLLRNWDAWGTHGEGFENYITSFHMKSMMSGSGKILRDMGADYLNAWLFFVPGIGRNYHVLDRVSLSFLGKIPGLKHLGMDYFILGKML